MKTLKKIFNIKTIRNRIILIQLAVVIPAIVLLGIMIYQRTSSLLIDTNSDAYYKILGSTEVILRNNLEYYRDIARNILADDVLQKELTGNRLQESDSKMMDEVTFVKIEQEMVKYVTGFSGLQSIYIYDSNGKLFYIDYKYGSAPASGLDYEEMSDAEWFRESSEYAGYEKFVGYNVITEDEEAFSCIKQLKDLDTQEPIGMLVLNFDKAALNRVLPSYNNEKGSYAIVEKDGANYHIVAYTPDSDLAPQQITDIMKGKVGKYHLSVYQDSTTGWEFVYVIENQYIVKEAQQIKQIILDMLLVTTLILSIFTILLCNRITRPLYQLRDSIVRVGDGERNIQYNFPDDEIGTIGQEFSKMVNDKLALSERVTKVELKNKEAELELLQSNINPHFLYNTLDSLYWMAIIHEAEDIAELTKCMSDIFKIALSEGDKFITVEKELDFVKSYLYIQNIRFENKINVEIQADETLMNYYIIKLLLQPFVENAVYHGIEPKIEGGCLIIKVYQKEGRIYFEVCDDGVGMEVETDIQRGYALRNSIERIKLVYGTDAGVEFYSEKGRGTKVVINFSMEEKTC